MGLRAQLASANLLTGLLAVDFDFFPDAPPASIDWDQHVPVIPTVPSPIQTLVADVGKFVEQLNGLPLDEIGADLRETVAHVNELLASLEGVTPSLIATLEKAEAMLASANELIAPDSSTAIELQRALHELAEAARSLRILADQLEQNPESLLRGKRGN